MSGRPVIAFETLGAHPTHEVVIDDPTTQMLADLYLPPDGTQISGDELEACVLRLVAATNVMKRLEQQERES